MAEDVVVTEYDWDAVTSMLKAVVDAAWEAFRQFAEAIRPVIEHAGVVIKQWTDTLYEVYLAQGAPYGEDHDGMFRWLDERFRDARLRWEDG